MDAVGDPQATAARRRAGRPERREHRQFAFAPATLTVKAGTTVTWTNKDEDPHTVVADDGAFRSQVLGSGGDLLVHLPDGGHVRLRLLDPPVHARHRGGDAMTETDRGSAWA